MFKNIILGTLCAALCGCATTHHAQPKAFSVSQNGTAKCRIVVAPDAPVSTQYAAQSLQKFLNEMTGAQIAIVADTVPVQAGEIVVGCNKHLGRAMRDKKSLEGLGKESYVISSNGDFIAIAGGEPRGTLYGVYGLLEDHLGCRWFTPEVSKIPKNATLTIPSFTERVTPALEYREPFVADCFDGDWAARNRMNSSSARLDDKHGGKVTYLGFVHTFNGLLPPEQYFDQHPEYFSLVKGKRLKERTQLCCTNEDVVKLVTEEVRKRMKEHPEATVFSVSQNDWYNYCECDKCKAIADQEGSEIGPVLFLVNRVAAAVAKEFPDKLVDTLAYQYTRKPPKTMRPEPNVIIRLCSIECCFSHSFEACDSPQNKEFVKDVEEWGKICNRLWVWNYNTSFSEYFSPFPNLRVRNDNIQFLERNHVKGIFEQDVYTTLNGELSGLSGYLGAKFLWNAAYDENTAIDEYLDAVYGKAAKPIREYIDLIHNRVDTDNLHMNIWIGPDHPLLDHGVLELSDHLFNVAEDLVKDQPDVLERVRIARMPVDFAYLERTRTEGLHLYVIDHETGAMKLRPEFEFRAKRFLETAQKSGVTSLRESNGDLGLYKKELESYQTATPGPSHPAVTVPGAKPGLTFRCYEGAWEKLPDFAKMKPVEQGVAESVSLDATKRRDAFGLEFTGYFRAPMDGIYLLHCKSNDGSKVELDNQLLIDNDGLHRATTHTGVVALKKGFHPIRVTYFESGGEEALGLYVEGPGIEKSAVPLSALWHK